MKEVYEGGMEEDQLFALMFVCEVLMLKNCGVFFDSEKIEKIAEIIARNIEVRLEADREICKEVGLILGGSRQRLL